MALGEAWGTGQERVKLLEMVCFGETINGSQKCVAVEAIINGNQVVRIVKQRKS